MQALIEHFDQRDIDSQGLSDRLLPDLDKTEAKIDVGQSFAEPMFPKTNNPNRKNRRR